MARLTDIQWSEVEVHYRAGVRALKDIGKEYDISDAAIIKRAKRDGWVRDLQAKIRAQAEAKVSAAMVSEEVSAHGKLTERAVIEANAEVSAQAQLTQRRDVARYRGLINALAIELEAEITSPELFEDLGDLMDNGKEEGAKLDKLNELYRKVISLPSRIDGAKKLAETLRILIELERKILKLDGEDETKGSGSVEDFLSKIGAA